jgi:monoamine oxidase
MLRRSYVAVDEARERDMPVEEVMGEHDEKRAKALKGRRLKREEMAERRHFLQMSMGLTGAALGAALLGVPRPARAGHSDPDVRIVIIGGGLSGLRCAHRLNELGIPSTLYEANPSHLGGRCHSDTTFFEEGAVVEHHGESINTQHVRMRHLTINLGFSLREIAGGSFGDGEPFYHIDGAFYTNAEANDDWFDMQRKFKQALVAAPYPQTFDAHSEEGVRLDNLPMTEWFAEIGAPDRFSKLVQSDTVAEYGLDIEANHALAPLYLLAWNGRSEIEPLTGGDERFTVIGGNDQVITAMADELPPGAVVMGKELIALSGREDGPYTLDFLDGTTAVADFLVLAQPISKLQELDIEPSLFATFHPAHQLGIQNMLMAKNSKLHVQFNERTWINPVDVGGGQILTPNGVCYQFPMDGFQLTWDETVGESSVNKGVLLEWFGGSRVDDLRGREAHEVAHPADVKEFLNGIDQIYPGTKAAYNGLALKTQPTLDPLLKGSYMGMPFGGYTSFFGAMGLSEGAGHLLFAGEHTNIDFWGFMEGAVAEGERAAREIHSLL